MLLNSLINIWISNPILVEVCVVFTGLSMLPEAGLKLCSLQPHVLQAAVHLCLDLLALHRESLQHAGFSAINTVPALFVHCSGLLVCQDKNTHLEIQIFKNLKITKKIRSYYVMIHWLSPGASEQKQSWSKVNKNLSSWGKQYRSLINIKDFLSKVHLLPLKPSFYID